eukprot:403340312
MKATEVLKHIQAKKSLNKDDLKMILKLSDKDKQVVISKISTTRQKLIMKYLEELPFLEDTFNFPLSRRESHHQQPGPNPSENNDPHFDKKALTKQLGKLVSPQLQPQQPQKQNLAKMDWMQQIKNKHDSFTFSNDFLEQSPSQQKKQKQRKNSNDQQLTQSEQKMKDNELNQFLMSTSGNQNHQLFTDESDQILALIKRIMYSEGDMINLNHDCAVYLKQSLQILSQFFKIELTDEELEEKFKEKSKKRFLKLHQKNQEKQEKDKRKKSMNHVNNVIDMTTLQFVFAENIQRFYAHKSLSKFYRDIFDAHQEEEDLEELAEQVQHDQEEGVGQEADLFRDIMGEEDGGNQIPQIDVENEQQSNNAPGQAIKIEDVQDSLSQNTLQLQKNLGSDNLQQPGLQQHKSMSEVLKELKEENDQDEEEQKSEDMVMCEDLNIIEHTTSSANFVDNNNPQNHNMNLTEQDMLIFEERRKEKLSFQNLRIQEMDEDEYLAFHQCRLANLLSRGKHLLCHWLDLNVELIEKRDLEIFAYVLRIMLAQIVEQAVRNRNCQSQENLEQQNQKQQYIQQKLVQIQEPLTLEDYKKAVDQVNDRIMQKIRRRELIIKSFKLFVQENYKQVESIQNPKERQRQMQTIKQNVWDQLDSHTNKKQAGQDSRKSQTPSIHQTPTKQQSNELRSNSMPNISISNTLSHHLTHQQLNPNNFRFTQHDFINRVEAEEHLINYLKSRVKSSEYQPVNEYARFLQDTITEQSKQQENEGFKVNRKFFKHLFYNVWNQPKE